MCYNAFISHHANIYPYGNKISFLKSSSGECIAYRKFLDICITQSKEQSAYVNVLMEMLKNDIAHEIFAYKTKPKTKLLQSTCIILMNIFSVIEEHIQKDPTPKWLDTNNSLSDDEYMAVCKDSAVVFRIVSDNTAGKNEHRLDDHVIGNSTFISAVKILCDQGLMIRHKGYKALNDHIDLFGLSFEIGYVAPRYDKLIEFYFRFKQNLAGQVFSALIKPTEETDSRYIKFRQKVSTPVTRNGAVVQENKIIDLDEIPLLKKQDQHKIEYSAHVAKMYSDWLNKQEFSIADLDDVSDAKCEQCFDEWNRKKHDLATAYSYEMLLSNIERAKAYVNSRNGNFNIHRLFHVKQRTNSKRYELMYGRYHGSILDNLTRELKCLLQINEKQAYSVDLKACIPMIHFVDVDKQFQPEGIDLYDISDVTILNDNNDLIIPTRSEVKLLVQMCANNPDENSAFRAFNNKMKTGKTIRNKITFRNVAEALCSKYNNYRSLFYAQRYLDIILIESDLMTLVIEQLIKNAVPFIYNYDSIYTTHDQINQATMIINKSSMKMFNRILPLSIE